MSVIIQSSCEEEVRTKLGIISDTTLDEILAAVSKNQEKIGYATYKNSLKGLLFKKSELLQKINSLIQLDSTSWMIREINSYDFSIMKSIGWLNLITTTEKDVQLNELLFIQFFPDSDDKYNVSFLHLKLMKSYLF